MPLQTIQNYPKIHIDRGSVIKPYVTDQHAVDQFIDHSKPGWKRAFQKGFPYVLGYLSKLKEPTSTNVYLIYFIKVIKYFAFLLLHLHQVYLYIYGYFYPYSLLPLDELCEEFCRCLKWKESVIRSFAWHPNFDRCAVAICNDNILIYQGPNRINVLRHSCQKKIVDMAWHLTNEQILVVATQTNIIVWKICASNSLAPKILDGSLSIAQFAPGINLVRRDVSRKLEPLAQHEPADCSNLRVLENIVPAPIVNIQFDQVNNNLLVCSPNSSKIAVINIQEVIEATPDSRGKVSVKPKYLRKFGYGVTKLLRSPTGERLAAATTSPILRVYESVSWSFKHWKTSNIIQDVAWSKPTGRILLVAEKIKPIVYAVSFPDQPRSGEVGGNRSLTQALDLTVTRCDSGNTIGGVVQSFAWDKEGKRLAILFKEHPHSILLYRTIERPSVEFQQLGIIQSDSGSIPLLMDFHDKYQNGSLLTICWSDGNCQHIPLTYAPHEQIRVNSSRSATFGHDPNVGNGSLTNSNSPSRVARSLTSFCHVSGSPTILPHQSSLTPINKLHLQKTLFTLEK